MLRRYAARGLRVVGLRTQVLAVEVLRHHARHLALVVTDRVVGGAAVGHGSRVRLPEGAAGSARCRWCGAVTGGSWARSG